MDRRARGSRASVDDALLRVDHRAGGRTSVQCRLQDERLGLRLHRGPDPHQPRHGRHRRLDADLRLLRQPEAGQRLERHVVAVRPEHHRQERRPQRAGRRGCRRLHRCPVQLQRQQHRAHVLRGQRHPLHRRSPAADRRADQPGRRRRLHPGRGGPAGGHRGRRGQRHDQQGGVLRRHQAAGHGHECALRAVRLESDRGQSFPGGEGLRQHGRLRRFHAGRHHRGLRPHRRPRRSNWASSRASRARTR
ncbi:hypothetical protein SVIOM74S_09165 [Streptomyces violarus]